MPIWQLCANLLIPNCLRSNLSYSPLTALELYVNLIQPTSYIHKKFIQIKIRNKHIRISSSSAHFPCHLV